MEGEKILAALKSNKSWESVFRNVVNYLRPVLSCTNRHNDVSYTSKYELFSWKLLRQCVEHLPGTSDPKQRQYLFAISEESCACFKICAGASEKVPPLSFEKMLLHLSKNCISVGDTEHCLTFCQLAHSLLATDDRLTSSKTSQKETTSLLKLVFDLLWRGAFLLDKKTGSALAALQYRKEALTSLLASGRFDPDTLCGRMMKVDQQFTHSNPPSLHHHLLDFHTSLLPYHTLLSLVKPHLPCLQFTTIFRYILRRYILHVKRGVGPEGKGLILEADSLGKEHVLSCSECDVSVSLSVHISILKIWAHITRHSPLPPPSQGQSLCGGEEVTIALREVGDHMKKVEESLLSYPGLHDVVEAVELVVAAIREDISTSSSTTTTYIHPSNFNSFKSMLLGGVACLDSILETTPTSMCARGRTRQLQLLSFLATLLVDLLSSNEGEVELPRDHTFPHDHTSPGQSHEDDEEEDCYKASLVTSCLPILLTSRDIINKVGPLLPSTEHKWLGNDAYRLARVLVQGGMVRQSYPILELSCQQLLSWCSEDPSNHLKRSLESRLLERYLYLADVQEKSGCYDAAEETFCNLLRSLPLGQLEAGDTVKMLTSQWARLKHTLSGQDGGDSQVMMAHSFQHLIEASQLRLSGETKIMYLEAELSCYRAQCHTPHPALVGVLEDMMLLLQDGGGVSRAHLAIQLACVCRFCTPQCQHKESWRVGSLLDQVLEGEGCASNLSAEMEQALATAHLWKAIIVSEIYASASESGGGVLKEEGVGPSSSGSCDLLVERVQGICLLEGGEEERNMLSKDTIQSLANAVEAWQRAWLNVQEQRGPLEIEDIFSHPLDMLQQIFLTALISAAHSQVSLAAKSLTILLHLISMAPPSFQTSCESLRSQALALLGELLAEEGGVASDIHHSLRQYLCQDGGGRGTGEGQGSGFLYHQLSLAQLHLAQGELADCRAVLLSLLDHPKLLEHTNTDLLLLCAKAKLITCAYLLHTSHPIVSTSRQFLAQGPSPTQQGEGGEEGPPSFKLLPIELAVDAVKLLWRLVDHKSVVSKGGGGDGGGVDGTPRTLTRSDYLSLNCLPWRLLLALLSGLRVTSRLYLLHGMMGEAYYFSREGAMLARTLRLHGWYVEFLLLLCNIFVEREQISPSCLLALQGARLLECSDLVSFLLPPPSTSPPEDMPSDHTSCDLDQAILGDDVIANAMSSLSIVDDGVPNKEHLPKLCCHGVSCVCALCTSAVRVCHTTTLVAMVARISSNKEQALTALEEAKNLLNQQKCKISLDLGPMGVALSGAKTRSKVRKRGRSAEKFLDRVGVAERMMVARSDVACTRALTCLSVRRPQDIEEVVLEALGHLDKGEEPGVARGYMYGYVLGRLHYFYGLGILQTLEIKQPELLKKACLGEGGNGRSQGHRLLKKSIDEFLLSYQYCFPLMPALLLRDTCQWLGVLLQEMNHAHHFLSYSQHISLSHQTALSLGDKIRKMGVAKLTSKSSVQHVLEVKQALDSSPQCPAPNSSLLDARHLLLPPSSPPTPHWTSSHLSLLPLHWTILTLALSPRTHPSSHTYLTITKVTSSKSCGEKVRGRRSKRRLDVSPPIEDDGPSFSISVLRLPGEEVEEVLGEFVEVLEEAGKCVVLQSRKAWWSARRDLDSRLGECLSKLQASTFQERADLVSSSESPVLLVLGPRLQKLPWESLPILQDKVVTRTPSLSFAGAHLTMVSEFADASTLDVHSAYFVVNPQGDLKKTEKLFGKWFSGEEGWEGVVGTPPETTQLSAALEEKDLYIYCGHSVGHYLGKADLHSLRCRATALLIGCSSAQLVMDGSCDPTGHVLTYLLAGCPALVGCLWSVTDGDIDRFCQSLVKSLLSSPPPLPSPPPSSSSSSSCVEENPPSPLLPAHVTAARSACLLKWLVGAAPVLYGLPIKPTNYQTP